MGWIRIWISGGSSGVKPRWEKRFFLSVPESARGSLLEVFVGTDIQIERGKYKKRFDCLSR